MAKAQPQINMEAARERAVATARLELALGERYHRKATSLATFQVSDPKQQLVLGQLTALLPRLREFAEGGRSLVFVGSKGTGKDHLLAAMLYHACAAGLSCHWEDGLELFGKFRDAIKRNLPEEGLIEPLVSPDVLAISDPRPPAGELRDFALGQLKRILDRRYRRRRGTWLTVNAASPRDLEQALTPSAFDRVMDGALLLTCFWESYRQPGERPGGG